MTNTSKTLSFVIPSYNMEAYLDRCVNSLLSARKTDDIEVLIVDDGSKDGTLAGPNVALLRDVAAATDAKIVASSGISVLDDVVELSRHADEGIDSAIIGKALYEGRFTLREALAAVEKQ